MKLFHSTFTFIEVMIVLVIIGFVAIIVGIPACHLTNGTGGFGPVKRQEVTIQRLYVDSAGKSGSHYMVGTDKGVFEVANGVFLGIWNSDELYSSLKEGKRFRLTTKGNRNVGFWMQEYPYVIGVELLP